MDVGALDSKKCKNVWSLEQGTIDVDAVLKEVMIGADGAHITMDKVSDRKMIANYEILRIQRAS